MKVLAGLLNQSNISTLMVQLLDNWLEVLT